MRLRRMPVTRYMGYKRNDLCRSDKNSLVLGTWPVFQLKRFRGGFLQ